MTALDRRTNGDLVQPLVDQVKKRAAAALEHFKAHPDELAVGAAPFLMLALATKRHRLNFAEAALVSEVAFWCGVFAVRAYQDWKDQDSAPSLRSVR